MIPPAALTLLLLAAGMALFATAFLIFCCLLAAMGIIHNHISPTKPKRNLND